MAEQYVNSFRIGGDPEYALLNPEGFVQYFTPDSGNLGVGSDHGGLVVELRPAPSYSVNGFLSNVRTLLESRALDSVRDLKWRSGAHFKGRRDRISSEMDIAMGGHIHIEVPYAHNDHSTIPSVDRQLFTDRMDAFDHVTKMMEEINILPKNECASRRSTTSYGNFGLDNNHHKVNGAGNQQRIEYRSPCSWLFHPRNAFLLITGLKLAAVSPVAIKKNVVSGSSEKIYAGFVKLFRQFQNVDHDSFIAATRICRSTNPDNLDRLMVDVTADFKPNWIKSKVVKTA